MQGESSFISSIIAIVPQTQNQQCLGHRVAGARGGGELYRGRIGGQSLMEPVWGLQASLLFQGPPTP